jgi:hypothetical protein
MACSQAAAVTATIPTIVMHAGDPPVFDRTNRLVVAYTWALPGWKDGNSFERTVTNGWKLSGTTILQSGKPMIFTDSTNGTAYGTQSSARAQFAPGMGNSNIVNKNGGTMLNRVKTNSYLNPGNTNKAGAVFATAPAVANGVLNSGAPATDYGNSSIGAARGPGNDNWDVAIEKATRVGGIHEDAALDFRTEFFNVWNHPEYTNPATSANAATYGQITGSAGSPRLIQFALKYLF